MTQPNPIKSYLKTSFPRTLAAYHRVRHSLTTPSLETVFTEIYHNNTWSDSESVSGRGSTLLRTEVIMTNLPPLLRELGAKTLLDAACGDFNWMQYARLPDIEYIGVDIVAPLIWRNRALYETRGRTFFHLDIARSRLPRADVILCRDCFIHLSFARIKKTILNFKKSGATYLFCTTHTTIAENIDSPDGGWRSLNLEIAPFNFPPPIRLIVENEDLGKCLGVWRVSDL
jgi:hypothetical protein